MAVPLERMKTLDGDVEAGISAAAEAAKDALLVERVLGGDAEAFGGLVSRHMRRAFSIAYRILEHREDSEDVVQDAFIRALDRLGTLERGRPFHPWFYRIVVNGALSFHRSRKLRWTDPIPEDSPSSSPSPELEAERSELRRTLAEAMDGLPDQQRLVVQLSELEGLNSSEISEIMDISAGTVRWHLHQARRALRVALEPLKEER